MKNNTKRTVVITGASAGVGRATAHAFAREGARIGLLARDEKRLEAVRQEVMELGGEGLILATDVADADQVELAAARVEEAYGPIQVWVNNAMVSVFSSFKDMTSDEFRRVTEVTYLGVVYGTSAALSRMIPRNSGTIIQVGSALAERSIPLQSAYCGAKHAIRGFTDSIRSELIHDRSRVHITMVQLPALNTPQFDWTKSRMPFKPQPVPPIFQPEIAADAIVWSSHHRRRELYVGMPTVKAMWGNKLIAGLLDRYLAKKGYSGQQTEELEERDRPNNMWRPVEGDFGTHGRFDARASGECRELWLAENKWLGLGLLTAGAGAALALVLRDRAQKPVT
ncbi:SDR family oxidoreductase [Geotalea sp. SG265]|uniref:SDR family oxidoreductase n=1 Tax=Geotalea sp. SG265 TaxID=2922867 RepID=UPI001FAF7FE2|nr:SDR family oxidoreductase [Geotalea sp. SG265]